MLILTVYSALFIIAGAWEYKRNNNMEIFAVAGRSSSTLTVTVSLVASCIGGSATIGLTALSWKIGFPSIWYLGSGVIGLMVLSVFLARKVRETGAKSLPEIVEVFISPTARMISAVIVITAWTAILAAQFSAASRIINSLTGLSFNSALLYGAVLIILYTIMGGQRSVLKSDIFQFAVIFTALFILVIYLGFNYPITEEALKLELFNEKFTFSSWTYYMVIIGGSYVICPMLFGRLLSARTSKIAYRSSLLAAVLLLVTAIMIVFIGLLSKSFLPADTNPDQILTIALLSKLPSWMGILLLLALFSAIISSADSCLITASIVFTNDILKKDSVKISRFISIFIGASALILSSSGKGILSLLFAANDIYVCGIVTPVFISMVRDHSKRMNKPITHMAMIGGGCFGLTAALTGIKIYSLAGVIFSLIFSISSLYIANNRSNL